MCKSAATLRSYCHLAYATIDYISSLLMPMLCHHFDKKKIAFRAGGNTKAERRRDEERKKQLPIAINEHTMRVCISCISKCSSMHLNICILIKCICYYVQFVFIARFNMDWKTPLSLEFQLCTTRNHIELIDQKIKWGKNVSITAPPSSCHHHRSSPSQPENKLTAVAHNDECG